MTEHDNTVYDDLVHVVIEQIRNQHYMDLTLKSYQRTY